MSSATLPDIYLNKGKVKPKTRNESTGAVLPEGYISPNKKLAQIAIQQQTEELLSTGTFNPADIPELPVEGESTSGQKTTGQRAKEALKSKLAPIYNPVLEVMNATNANFLGTAWDLTLAIPQTAQGLYNKATTGDFTYSTVPKPEQLTNLQYVPNAEDADILDKGAFYSSLGVSMSAGAQKLVNKYGQKFVESQILTNRAGTVALKARPAVGSVPVASKRQNVLRDIAAAEVTAGVALANEVGIGLAMSAGGQVGKAQDVKVLGVDVLTLPFEIVAGLSQAVKQAPKQANTVLNAWEKKFGEDPVALARRKMRGKSNSPLEAEIALTKNADDELLPDSAVAIKTEDPGILSLERAIAAVDPIFAAHVNEGVDFAQASLAREFSSLTDPSTGALSFVAFEKLLPKIQDDIFKQVDDRVTLAQEELATILRIHEGDTVASSKEFSQAIDDMFADLHKQETDFWQPINDHVEIPTVAVRTEIIKIVNGIPKTKNIPVKILERLTGLGIVNTNRGWKTTGDSEIKKQPVVRMLSKEAPSVLKDERSNLTTIMRNSKKTDRTAETYDPEVLQAVQTALLKGLTDGVSDVAPELQRAYVDALTFTKNLHKITTSKDALLPKVKKAQPEKSLEVLLKAESASQSDMAIAARELTRLTNIVSDESAAATSTAKKNAEQYLLNRFSKIDPTDLANFDKFIALNRDWLVRYPETASVINAARNKAKNQGVVVKNLETEAAAARLNQFSSIAGKSPEAMITHILGRANPTASAVKFKKLLGQNKVALQEFKDHIASNLAAKALKEVDNQVAGTGTQKVIKPVSFKEALKELGPLVKVFNTEKEMKGLQRLYNHSVMVANSIQAKRGADGAAEQSTNLAYILSAKIVALKAVNFFAGSQSIVLANTASNFATKAIQSMSHDVANNIIKEGLKNEELMKILLTDNITTNQLKMLNSNKFQTGRTLFKAITEAGVEETTEQE